MNKKTTKKAESEREAGGLFAREGARVPLRGVAIEIAARGTAARVTVAQRYRNAEDAPVEAVYSFPLQESAAVCGFEVEIDGKRIVGRVEERERAFEEYDAAMAHGHGAFLLDQDRPNVFTASVGNLLAGQEAIVRLTYVTELERQRDRIRLMIPTTISPRYIPADVAAEMDPAELDHIAPPTVAGGVPYGLSLRAEIEAASEIRSVECPSHPARVTLRDRTATVELAGNDIQLDRDFVVELELAQPHAAAAVLARDDWHGERLAMIDLFPDLAAFERVPCEILFLIDRSGSMQGSSIGQAANALMLCLRALAEGDRFNVVGFGSTFASLFPESRPYDQHNLDRASAYARALEADLGGTELAAPLRSILEQPPRDGMPRRVVLLTDGQVGNEQQCIDLARAHAQTTQIFTFGIGYGASEYLVRALARVTMGRAELIHPNERIEPVVMRQFARVTRPALRNVRMDWGTLEVDLCVPAVLPALFDGDRVTIYARIAGGTAGEACIVADGPAGEMRFAVPIDPEAAQPDPIVPALMARAEIRELEESGPEQGTPRGSAQAAARRAGKVRARIVELGCRHNLVSSVTSFVAIEQRPEGAQVDRAELRRIPVALTKGWHGIEAPPIAFAAPAAPLHARAAQKHCRYSLCTSITRLMSAEPDYDVMPAPRKKACKGGKRGTPPPRERAPARDRLAELTDRQDAEGAWALDAALARSAGVRLATLRRAARELGVAAALASRIVGTLVALRFLERDHADRADEWRLLAAKARRWLAARNVAPPDRKPTLDAWIKGVLGEV